MVHSAQEGIASSVSNCPSRSEGCARPIAPHRRQTGMGTSLWKWSREERILRPPATAAQALRQTLPTLDVDRHFVRARGRRVDKRQREREEGTHSSPRPSPSPSLANISPPRATLQPTSNSREERHR